MSVSKIISVFLFCMFFCVTACFPANKIDGIAAIVGDSVILNSELDSYSQMRLNNASQKADSAELPKIRKQFLTELIDGKILVVHAAKDTNIVLKEAEIEQALSNQVQSILQQNNITMATLEQELKSKYNMTLLKFKTQMRMQIQEQLLRQKVQQLYVSPSIQISRKDVETFYSTYGDSLPQMGESLLMSKLKIHVTPSESIRQTAFAKINGIKQRLNNGEKFSKLAKEFSEDSTGADSGDLGFIKKGTLSEIVFEEKAFSLNPGQISDVFESRLGFHIIMLLEKKEQMVHVQQIFVKVAPPADFALNIMKRLDSIRTNCTTQKDFVTAIKKYDNSGLTTNDGRMGWQSLYELPETIKTAVDSLKSGEISKPLRDGDDFTIYRVDERKSQRKLTLEDDYQFLSEKTREIIAQKKLMELVKKWRQEVFVEIRL